ncbi:MAG: hypothetical protein ABEH59_12300 [Halobacteriales archaeon]
MDSEPPVVSDRSASFSDRSGHELVAIDAWLPPGTDPFDDETEPSPTDGQGSRVWRCTACGQERRRRDRFTEFCLSEPLPESVIDGGYSIDDERTKRALAPELTVQFLAFGSHYAVEERGTRYIVDIDGGACTCDADDVDGPCVHLRRVDLAIRTGALPGPDGRYDRCVL